MFFKNTLFGGVNRLEVEVLRGLNHENTLQSIVIPKTRGLCNHRLRMVTSHLSFGSPSLVKFISICKALQDLKIKTLVHILK